MTLCALCSLFSLCALCVVSCSVLGAVQIYVAKHKLLRESDALKFLTMSSNAILLSGVFMTLGILGLVLAVFPVIHKTYGQGPLIFSVFLFVLIIPYVLSNGFNYLKRHAYFYYMAKGRAASKAGNKPGAVTAEHHDPYDATVAWKAFKEWMSVGAALAGRDADLSNMVDVTEMEMAEALLAEQKAKEEGAAEKHAHKDTAAAASASATMNPMSVDSVV